MRTAIAQRVGAKGQVVIPKRVREALGLKAGDLVETVMTREGALTRPVILVPKKVDLRTQLEAAEADVKAGRVLGPFKTAGAAMKAVKAHARRAHRYVRR